MYGPAAQVGDLVKIRRAELTEHIFAGIVGVVIDIVEMPDGYISYEVLCQDGKEWFQDYEVKSLDGD
jgi:hypothetical protein